MRGREPGVVGSVMSSDQIFSGIIADGHHVDAANIKIATRAIPDHLCLVTDAMQTLSGTKTTFIGLRIFIGKVDGDGCDFNPHNRNASA